MKIYRKWKKIVLKYKNILKTKKNKSNYVIIYIIF